VACCTASSRDRPLDQAPGQEHLARFFDTRAGHHRAAIGPQQYHAFMGQARQRAANDGAAHAKDFAECLFAQFGTGCQALFENRLEDMRVDDIVLGSAAAGLAGSRLFLERLQLFVHGHSDRENGGELTVIRQQRGAGKYQLKSAHIVHNPMRQHTVRLFASPAVLQ